MEIRSRLAGLAVVVAVVAALLCLRPAAPDGAAADAPAPAPATATDTEWERPRFGDRAADRYAMVRRDIQREGVRDSAVLAAMRQVPRHEFVPSRYRRRAYDDRPLPIGHGQTISQPYIVAYMTQQLGLRPGDKVLEIGTGSGYQAAVLSELTPHVYTIEIIEALGKAAKTQFQRLGYKTIQCRIADGYYGWPEQGPFDAIIVTCAAGTIPPPLVKQLKVGGRMCIPVGPTGATQRLILVTKDSEGQVKSRSLIPVVFVPLTRKRK